MEADHCLGQLPSQMGVEPRATATRASIQPAGTLTDSGALCATRWWLEVEWLQVLTALVVN